MAAHSSNDDEIVGINVTPLVDITLVLLIIFMVTAKLVMAQGMPLDLPKAATAGEIQTVFNVRIDAEGHMQANGRDTPDDDALKRAIEAAQASAKGGKDELRAVLSASTRVSHGTVMHALDVLRAVGVSKVAFAADKEL